MLAIDGLDVRYGSVRALHGVTLRVEEGEVVGLIGPNGAGKSTLLHTVMGLVAPAAGDVRLRGDSLVGRPTERITRSGVALVPEGRRVFGQITVDENLRLGLLGRRDAGGADDDLARVHELFPVLRDFRQRKAGILSGGQQQMLAIARALLSQPDLLLLDEPSLGLAPALVEDVFAALEAIRADGRTILIVEQRAQRTVAFADRTEVLAGGEMRLTLGPEDAAATERMAEAYFGA
ncbi:ABC transporter ATP-binding protein [Egibacter rhizosphaerae]|uniref:ABC transporter ATP-binding protein n=1 Tax=Egibacter rhizosphaerae TaxID=1670831 RepID=A0A411YGW4_9ACTN|nr:ABC transporter ATP-binding protein [Egibacter rhizosphaerae]QBI20396.1 ABC transporter ATP-binding protein [Egibacter rhizosphaerae]